MIKSLAEKTARYIVANDDTADFEVMAYGYELIYQEVGITLLALLISIPFGLVPHVLLSIVVYNLLRKYTGGSHAAHRIVCTVSSILILYGPAFLFTRTGTALSIPTMAVLYVADMILLVIYAPADTDIHPIQSPDKRRHMKLVSLAILTLYFIAAVLFYRWLPIYTSILMTQATIISLCTHPLIYRILGCNKSMDVEENQ